jgi:hypothetical protein
MIPRPTMTATKMGIDPPEMRYATTVVTQPMAATERSERNERGGRGPDGGLRAASSSDACAGGPGGSFVVIAYALPESGLRPLSTRGPIRTRRFAVPPSAKEG